MKRALLSLALLSLAACHDKAERLRPAEKSGPRQPLMETPRSLQQSTAAPTQPAVRQLGAAPKLAGDPVPVAQLLTAPEPYLGKTVKCEGKVARVCQAAGCWLELQAESGGEGLRVPMAAHAFFVPQDAVGHSAVVEGELRRQVLPAAQKKHYESEGMQAVGPLALDATSVLIR